jgi:2'-5' RNA ligase
VQRLFVALDIPNELRATLAATRVDTETWRRVKDFHVTLAFLGDRPETDVSTIEPIIGAERTAPHLALGHVLLLPPRRPRVLTVTLDDPTGALRALHARVTTALEAAGLYTRESRPFRPHVTLARLRPRIRPPREAPVDIAHTPFHGRALTLYASRLHPDGARYEALITQSLGYIQP